MNLYYDTGVLVALYVEEVFSSSINAFVEKQGVAITVNAFHRLEFENAVRLKVFRGDIQPERAKRVLCDVDMDVDCGRLVMRPLDWNEALDTARSISRRATAQVGCRTLDILHVALALQWGCGVFVSADARQLEASGREGLDTVDARHLR